MLQKEILEIQINKKRENFDFLKLSEKSKNRREAAKFFGPQNEGGEEIFSKSENKIDIALRLPPAYPQR